MLMDGQIVYWHWLIAAVVLVTLEIFMPSTFFLWLGVAAGVVGAMLWLIPDMSWEVQLVLYAVLSVLSIVIGRMFFKRWPIKTDEPLLNKRGHQYVGRVFTLSEPVVNGVGKVRVDDSTWKIEGNDTPAGVRVRITGVDGTILKFEPLDMP
jgi:membrane protein implicated in regulation of membrane protease activity